MDMPDALYALGEGKSHTNFEYSNLQIYKKILTAIIDVINIGDINNVYYKKWLRNI